MVCRSAVGADRDGGGDQVDVQLKIVSAWIKWADGDHNAAVEEMRTAAAMENATEKIACQSRLHYSRAGDAGRYVAFGKAAETPVGCL